MNYIFVYIFKKIYFHSETCSTIKILAWFIISFLIGYLVHFFMNVIYLLLLSTWLVNFGKLGSQMLFYQSWVSHGLIFKVGYSIDYFLYSLTQ